MIDYLATLRELGFERQSDLLFILPRSVVPMDKIKTHLPRPGLEAEEGVYLLRLKDKPQIKRNRSGAPYALIQANDELGISVKTCVYGQNISRISRIGVGEKFGLRGEPKLIGRTRWTFDKATVWSIDLITSGALTDYGERTVSTGKITSAQIARSVNKALNDKAVMAEAVDRICRALNMDYGEVCEKLAIKEKGFAGIEDWLRAIHQPETTKRWLEARRILATWLEVERAAKVQMTASQKKVVSADSVIRIAPERLRYYASLLPFALNAEQWQAVNEIAGDLADARSMWRLLSGDVGTGKTAVFGVVAAAAAELCAWVCVLVPNALLARQIHADLCQWFASIKVALITGGERTENLYDCPIWVGTTAMMSFAGERAPALLIVDEQQKLSVQQREMLAAEATNILEVTATAIPRTQALIEYGGMDVSILRSQPVEKQIYTRITSRRNYPAVLDLIERALASGGRAAIIYPRREEERRSVEEAKRFFEKRFGALVATAHGGMSEDEVASVIRELSTGAKRVLLTTTVLEVGVTIPELRVLVVVGAESYGVAQLHQLRGRLARRGGTGAFILMASDDISETAQARLNLVAGTNDGFALAEGDLALRGAGDLRNSSMQQKGQETFLFRGLPRAQRKC